MLGVPQDQLGPAMGVIRQALLANFVIPSMPIRDVIDLAEFLVNTTAGFFRFLPRTLTQGGPFVGGAVEIAAITKHENFKWVKRKHYYPRELNPEVS